MDNTLRQIDTLLAKEGILEPIFNVMDAFLGNVTLFKREDGDYRLRVGSRDIQVRLGPEGGEVVASGMFLCFDGEPGDWEKAWWNRDRDEDESPEEPEVEGPAPA